MGGGGVGANNVIEITRVQCRSWAVRVRQSSGMEQAGVEFEFLCGAGHPNQRQVMKSKLTEMQWRWTGE